MVSGRMALAASMTRSGVTASTASISSPSVSLLPLTAWNSR